MSKTAIGLCCIGLLIGQAPAGLAQAGAFTYQGRLTDSGNPANGIYDLRFALFNAATGGVQIGSAIVTPGLPVTNGLVTALLDFGSPAFNGDPRWLEIGVRVSTSTSPFTTLAPRQPITATPYALHALAADSFTSGLNSASFWQTRGNTGTIAGSDFLGTADNRPLELRVNQIRAIHLAPYAAGLSLAAGSRARAVHPGSFVWADSSPTDFVSATNNQFRVRAMGGAEFVTGLDASGTPATGVQMTATGGLSVSVATNGVALELRRGAIKVTGAGLSSKTPVFVHLVTDGNQRNNLTIIDHPLCNGDPRAILIVTPVLNPGDPSGGLGVANTSYVGVYYTGTNSTFGAADQNKWGIYNQNSSTMQVGAAFNVLVIKP